MRTRNPSVLFVAMLSCLVPFISAMAGTDATAWRVPDDYEAIPFQLPNDAVRVYLLDFDGDERDDFLIDKRTEILLLLNRDQGFDLSSSSSIPIPKGQAVWDIARGHSENGTLEVFVLIDGQRIESWQLMDDKLSGPNILVDDLNATIRSHNSPMRFCRDLNSDGVDDLVIPRKKANAIFLSSENGGFTEIGEVKLDTDFTTRVHNDRLDGTVGQTIRYSRMEFRDVNGDENKDLIVRTKDLLEITLADPGIVSYFPPTPSYVRDFSDSANLAERVTLADINFGDLFANFAKYQHSVTLQDIDQDKLDDLVVQTGHRVILYKGTANGVSERASQVLRMSSHSIGALLVDFDADGEHELLTIEAPQISLARVLLWIALPQSTEFSVLVYEIEDGLFSRRPIHRLVIRVELPSGLAVFRKSQKIDSRLDRIAKEEHPFVHLQMNSNPEGELIMIDEGEVRLYFDSVPVTNLLTQEFLFERLVAGDAEITVSVPKVLDALLNAAFLPDLVAGREPLVMKSIGANSENLDLLQRDLNRDNYDDLFIFTDSDEQIISGTVLMSNP